MIEMEPLNIDSDKFKYEACTITNEECGQYSCKTCEIAIAEMGEILEEEDKSVYTFESRIQHGISGEINRQNTVLKCNSVDDAVQYIGVGRGVELEKFTKIIGSLDQEVIDTEYPHYNIVVQHLVLKTSHETYYRQHYPLITVHGDIVIVVAPKIEDD